MIRLHYGLVFDTSKHVWSKTSQISAILHANFGQETATHFCRLKDNCFSFYSAARNELKLRQGLVISLRIAFFITETCVNIQSYTLVTSKSGTKNGGKV